HRSSQMKDFRTVIIENVQPELDSGRYPIKREVGDELVVEADIFKEGHDLIMASLLYRRSDEQDWARAPMELVDNDRWRGSFCLSANTRYQYTVEASPDLVRSWVADLKKKLEAGQDVSSDLLEGQRLLQDAAARASGEDQAALGLAAQRLGSAGSVVSVDD